MRAFIRSAAILRREQATLAARTGPALSWHLNENTLKSKRFSVNDVEMATKNQAEL
jgi:hypothetical protein